NQYGRDVEETFDQIEAEKQMAEQYGVKLAFQPFGGGQSAYGAGKIVPETGEPIADSGRDDPIELNLKLEGEKRKKSIKIVRDESGMIVGAETQED
ncbi:MAG: hypothetical protein ACO3SE_09265, partial [Sedimenticolaceae bacterium]